MVLFQLALLALVFLLFVMNPTSVVIGVSLGVTAMCTGITMIVARNNRSHK